MKQFLMIIVGLAIAGCSQNKIDKQLAHKIRTHEDFALVKNKAVEVVKSGFNAGDGYGEVWIRDYNTFIELSCEIYDAGDY